VVAARPDVAVFAGGLIEIPAGSDFYMRYGLPAGVTFACLAETILLSFVQATEPDRLPGLLSVGETLDPRALRELGELADRHGVRLADLRTTPPAPAAPVVPGPRVELHAFGTRRLHQV
jgi:predicted amino acid dehydrogenase